MTGALLLAASLASPLAVAGERRYAVVVGVNEGEPDEEPLRFAERDALRMADVLQELAGVAPEDLVLLRGGDVGRLERVLEQVAARVATEAVDGERQLLFVYYSGHADAQALHLRGSALSHRRLAALAEAVPANVRVLVVDACRSGELTRLKGAAPVEPFAIEVGADRVRDRLASDGLAIITSSSVGEDAQESDRLQGGVFTHHILGGLQGAADASGDGQVTLTELYDYSYQQTIETTSRAPFVQHPAYAFDLRGRDDLVLTDLASADRSGWVRLPEGGAYLIFASGRDGALVSEVTVPANARLALGAGAYTLRRREADRAWQAEVRVASGEEVIVDEMELVPYGWTVRKGYSERRAALAGLAGAQVAGPMLPETSPGVFAYAGLRIDLEALTLVPRLRFGVSGSSNADVDMRQLNLGADVAALRFFDVGPAALGAGLRAGADGARQSFDSEGEADGRQALIGRAGPALRAEWAPAGRWLLGLELGADIHLVRYESLLDEQLSTPVVPHVSLDLARY